MRVRWLTLFPVLYALGFAVVAGTLTGDGSLAPFVAWQRILTRILALAGCYAAVSVFESGDHLRRAWLWLGGGTLVILTRDLLRLLIPAFGPDSTAPAAMPTLAALGVIANLALLSGILELSRSWRKASIELPGGRVGVVLVALVTAAVALLVAGPAALQHAQAFAEGDWSALVLLVSALVDILTLCLITPLLLTAVALRNGLFVWPWALITASQVCWLLYDAAQAYGPAPGPSVFPLPDVFRGMAENFVFAAGMAQYLVIRHVRRVARGG